MPRGTAHPAAALERAQDEIPRLGDERAELYGRLGFMQAELAQAREWIPALEAPREPPPSPPPPAGVIFRPLPSETGAAAAVVVAVLGLRRGGF